MLSRAIMSGAVGPPNKLMNVYELAWLAGIYDGEGTIRLYNTNDKRKRFGGIKYDLRITNCDPLIMNESERIIRKLIGEDEKLPIHPFKGPKSNYISYHLQITNRKNISIILKEIIPYLIGKKAEAKILLAYVEKRLKLQPNSSGKVVPIEINDLKYVEEIKSIVANKYHK